MTTPFSTVAVVSSGDSTGLGGSLKRGFADLGFIAHLIPEPLPLRVASSALLRLPVVPALRTAVNRCVQSLQALRPQLIVVVKGSFLDPGAVAEMRRVAPVVCWNPDSPFDHAISNRGGHVQEAIAAYDGYVTWTESLRAAISDLARATFVVPFGIDPTLHRPCPGPGVASGRLVFIGSPSPERVIALRRLARYRPLVFGTGWRGEDAFELKPAVTGNQFAAIAGEARICLNLLRPQNRSSHNMRTFELLACGARQLTYDTADHRRFLHSGAILVRDLDELVERAGDDVSVDPPSEADLQRHTYTERCRSLVRQLSEAEITPRGIERLTEVIAR